MGPRPGCWSPIGTSLAALIGAKLINYWSCGVTTFRTPLGVAKFVLIAFCPMAPINVAGASICQVWSGGTDFSDLIETGSMWWIVDAAGTILIAPVIVLWATSAPREFSASIIAETIVIMVVAAAIGAIAFIPSASDVFNYRLRDQHLLGFLILLPLMWAENSLRRRVD
jgi:integral membrane sensor domain MASE1